MDLLILLSQRTLLLGFVGHIPTKPGQASRNSLLPKSANLTRSGSAEIGASF